MYGQSRTGIKHFDSLKTWTLWAGALGVVQAIIWIGLTITAILAYTCNLYITDDITYGSYLKIVFFDVYFHGNCKLSPSDYQNYDRTVLNQVETVFDPTQLLIWNCVYLGVSVCWLIFSIMLIFGVRKDNVKLTLASIYIWAFFVTAICAMDAASGVIFGIDYGRFHTKAFDYNANDINAGAIDPNAVQLVFGGVAAIAMMLIAFKGFVMWFINFKLLIYITMLAVRIGLDKDRSDTLFMPRKDSNDILPTRPPIRAYEQEKVDVQVYSNEAFMPDTRSTTETIEVNEEAIVRAAHMSRDANLMDRRFRSIDAFQQYPAPNSSRPVRQSSQVPKQETVVMASSAFPMADYSPQNSPNPNGILRQY